MKVEGVQPEKNNLKRTSLPVAFHAKNNNLKRTSPPVVFDAKTIT